jgi:hypothetical protein
MTFALLAFCAFAQAAFAKEPAKEPDCRAIKDTSARLICYDAAYPPKPEKPVSVPDDGARAEYKDPFKAEADHTAAKLKNICRGC